MPETISSSELLSIMNERDKHTQEQFNKVALTLDKMCEHMIISQEDKKHDADFKKEVREFIVRARPMVLYVEDQKCLSTKLKTAFFVALMFAVLFSIGLPLK